MINIHITRLVSFVQYETIKPAWGLQFLNQEQLNISYRALSAGGNLQVNMEGIEIDILWPDSINPLVFLFIDFHLYKSATEEQTNLPVLSVLSEDPITCHLLHCAKLIMSGVACNGCSEYTTLISTMQRCVSLNHNEKIKFNYLCRHGFCLTFMLEVRNEMH